MEEIENKIAEFVAVHCRWLALVSILTAAVSTYLLRNVHINNATEVWLGTHNPARQDYHEFLAK